MLMRHAVANTAMEVALIKGAVKFNTVKEAEDYTDSIYYLALAAAVFALLAAIMAAVWGHSNRQ